MRLSPLRFLFAALVSTLLAAAPGLRAAPKAKSGFITTPDHVKIHYIEEMESRRGSFFAAAAPYPGGTPPTFPASDATSGINKPVSVLLIPGWTMPAWIWQKQLEHLAPTHRVVAMDPRGQGDSGKPTDGYYPQARARDIHEVVTQLHLQPVVLVGWSMAVNELAAYVDQFGTDDIAGLVLVDGAAGFDLSPEMTQGFLRFFASFQQDRAQKTAEFVRSMFKKPQSQEYLDRLTQAALKTPTDAAMALSLGVMGSDFRAALVRINRPTLICLSSQGMADVMRDMQKRIANARLQVFEDAGHALFVDDADRFNGLLDEFLDGVREPMKTPK